MFAHNRQVTNHNVYISNIISTCFYRECVCMYSSNQQHEDMYVSFDLLIIPDDYEAFSINPFVFM